jgi:hypothetical protein
MVIKFSRFWNILEEFQRDTLGRSKQVLFTRSFVNRECHAIVENFRASTTSEIAYAGARTQVTSRIS